MSFRSWLLLVLIGARLRPLSAPPGSGKGLLTVPLMTRLRKHKAVAGSGGEAQRREEMGTGNGEKTGKRVCTSGGAHAPLSQKRPLSDAHIWMNVCKGEVQMCTSTGSYLEASLG